MLYSDFIIKAKEATITQADNGLFYLEPMWRSILDDNRLYFNDVSDFEAEPSIVEDVLKLEVEKRNIVNSKKPAVLDWLYELINEQIEPAMLEEETNYLKDVTEYLKTKKEAEAVQDEDWKKFTSN